MTETSSKVTSTGIPVPSRVLWKNKPGRLWGIGFDPKGELCMVQLDSDVSIQCRAEDLALAPIRLPIVPSPAEVAEAPDNPQEP